MSYPQSDSCSHPDIRNFADLRTCLSCGFALELDTTRSGKSNTGSDKYCDNEPKISLRVYTFKKLNYELGREIRLVHLKPGLYDENLRCTIIHANLDDNPGFEAVSYTWADQNGKIAMSKHIICQDGTYINISDNCDAVLRRIRAKGAAKTIWIDMLCIDQKNTSERNHQVGMMDAIYRKAQLVIVDLGSSTKSSETLYDKMADCTDERPLPVQGVIHEILHRRWFFRGWVLQEVVLAKHAVVNCGLRTITWDTLRSFLQRHIPSRELPAVMTIDCSWSNLMDISGLVRTLGRTQSCFVTDPRDKIYALLGLCRPDLRLQLPVDYSLTIKQLFLRVAVLYVKQRKGNESILLQQAGGFYKCSEPPSWIPRWTSPDIALPIPPQLPWELTRAPGSTVLQNESDFDKLQLGILQIRGRLLDNVAFVGTRHRNTSNTRQSASAHMVHVFSPEQRAVTIEEFMWREVSDTTVIFNTGQAAMAIREYAGGDLPDGLHLLTTTTQTRVISSFIRRNIRHSQHARTKQQAMAITEFIAKHRSNPQKISKDKTEAMAIKEFLVRHDPDIWKRLAELNKGILDEASQPFATAGLKGYIEGSEIAAGGRVLFGTTRRFPGFGSPSLRSGDGIWVLEGQRSCFALRRSQKVWSQGDPQPAGPTEYELLGGCFYYSPETVLGERRSEPKSDWELISLI